MPHTPDLKAFLAAVLTEVCFGDETQHPLTPTIDRYFAPDYRQRADGVELDRASFEAHIRHVRSTVSSATVEIMETLQEGNRIADRHLIQATKRDGSVIQVEVHLFGELAQDGRIRRINEVSRLIAGTKTDAQLSHAQ